MNKWHKVLIVVVAGLVVVVGPIVFWDKQPADACTAKDREQNNCVPAGRCTPPGHPQEQVIDCDVKDYDRKFDLSV